MIDEAISWLAGAIAGGLVGVVIVAALFNPLAERGSTPYERSIVGRLLSWLVVGLAIYAIFGALS